LVNAVSGWFNSCANAPGHLTRCAQPRRMMELRVQLLRADIREAMDLEFIPRNVKRCRRQDRLRPPVST